MKTPNLSRRGLLTGGLATILSPSITQGTEVEMPGFAEKGVKSRAERANTVLLTAKASNELTQSDTTYVLQNDVYGNYCFLARAPHITLDLNGHTINGDQSTTIGFFGDKLDDLVVRNGVIKNFSWGIVLRDSKHNRIEDVDLKNNAEAISLASSSYNSLKNVRISDSYLRDIFFGAVITGFPGLRWPGEEPTSGEPSIHNILLDCIYDPKKESVEEGNLLRNWSYRARVQDSEGNPIHGARLTAFNFNQDLKVIVTTRPNGTTPRVEINQYEIVGGELILYAPYRMHVAAAGFKGDVHELPADKSNLEDRFYLTAE